MSGRSLRPLSVFKFSQAIKPEGAPNMRKGSKGLRSKTFAPFMLPTNSLWLSP